MSSCACKACMHFSVLQPAVVALLAASLAACGGLPRPTEQVELARAAVSQAQPIAATEGAPELKSAEAKLSAAEQAMKAGDHVAARVLAEQAEVDAKYAWTLAESARMQRAAAEVDQSVKLLRDELDRRAK
jgi:hypothetical protein